MVPHGRSQDLEGVIHAPGHRHFDFSDRRQIPAARKRLSESAAGDQGQRRTIPSAETGFGTLPKPALERHSRNLKTPQSDWLREESGDMDADGLFADTEPL